MPPSLHPPIATVNTDARQSLQDSIRWSMSQQASPEQDGLEGTARRGVGGRPAPTAARTQPTPPHPPKLLEGPLGVPEQHEVMGDFFFLFSNVLYGRCESIKRKKNCKSCPVKSAKLPVSKLVYAPPASPHFLFACPSVWGALGPNTSCWLRYLWGMGGRVIGTGGRSVQGETGVGTRAPLTGAIQKETQP